MAQTNAEVRIINMKLIVGLGNPGKEYERTRHNAGFIFVDELVKIKGETTKWKEKNNYLFIKEKNFIACKPQTFMNASGEAVKAIAKFHKIESVDIVVVHDDLDLPLGNYKLQKAKGPKVHNGITSVESSLGTKDFWRIRLGIENRPSKKISGEAYVLERMPEDDLTFLLDSILEAIDSKEFKLLLEN